MARVVSTCAVGLMTVYAAFIAAQRSVADQVDLSLDAASIPPDYNLNDGSSGQEPVDRFLAPPTQGQTTLYFSVDRVAVGLPGYPVGQFRQQTGCAAAALFSFTPGQGTALYKTPGDLGLQGGFFGDDIDGLQVSAGSGVNINSGFAYQVLWRNSPLIGTFGPADIFLGATNTLFASGSQLGLQPGDGIDGLVVLDVTPDPNAPGGFQRTPNGVVDPGLDLALFSLDPFSPTVLSGAAKPGDVLLTSFQGSFSTLLDASALGLLPSDNLDALSLVPDPPTIGLLLVAGLALRRRSY